MSTSPSPIATAAISPAQAAACIAWAVVVAVGGGFSCGWLMVRLGMLGAIGLMILGIIAGLVAWQITRRGTPWIGWMLAAAVLIAFVLANMFWLRYANFVLSDNAKTWMEAARKLTGLFDTNPQHFFITLVCAAFGAYNAYSSAGSRWHRVRE